MRTASFNAPNYGPIAPPSRLGRPSTRGGGNRGPVGPVGPSASHNNGFGSPRASRTSNASEANLYAALMDRVQGRDGNDDTGGDPGEEEEEQRGARL